VQIRYRRALPQDISRGREILEPERILFSPRTWQLMPELLQDLLARERILLCALDNVETGQMVAMGASGFLRPDFLEAALAGPGGLIDAVFTAESEGRPAFLNRKEIKEANRAADLRLMNFFGTPRRADWNDGTLEILVGRPPRRRVLPKLAAWRSTNRATCTSPTRTLTNACRIFIR
jgi:hypothetical protein